MWEKKGFKQKQMEKEMEDLIKVFGRKLNTTILKNKKDFLN